MSHSRWQLPPRLPAEQLSKMNLPPLMAQLLYNRGITDPADVDPFLAADERLLNDPFLLPDMDKAVARVYRALLSGETIAIYGDFDADGITATVLLAQGLSSLGGRAVPYIPRRAEEGYGLNHAALENLHDNGVSLVITVDCGISSIPEVERAQRMGLDIVITDHHTVPPQMPQAVAVVDPKRADSRYPFPKLAGVGMAFKLLQALLQSLGKDGDMEVVLDLVALGTVADMEPLLGENRYLVKQGLAVLRNTSRLGLREMARCAGIPLSAVDPEIISWVLGPRLNAAGRLDHAIIGYEIVNAMIKKLPGFPEETRKRLLHMILSHHGEARLGAPVVPQTVEAIALHMADYLDAQLRQAVDAQRKGEEAWSEYIQGLKRFIYIGEE